MSIDKETRQAHAHILEFSDKFFAGADSVDKLIDLVCICNRQISETMAAVNARGALTPDDAAAYSLTSCAARAILEVIRDMCNTEYPDLLEKRLREKIRERLKVAPVHILTPPS